MTISKPDNHRCFVWKWLPGESDPVVAGVLTIINDEMHFAYGQSYLARANAEPIYAYELPLMLLTGIYRPQNDKYRYLSYT